MHTLKQPQLNLLKALRMRSENRPPLSQLLHSSAVIVWGYVLNWRARKNIAGPHVIYLFFIFFDFFIGSIHSP